MNTVIQNSNPLLGAFAENTEVILFAHGLLGTPRGKSANGLMIHSKLFNVTAIVDRNSKGLDTSEICKGVKKRIPIYEDVITALNKHKAKALIFLIEPDNRWFNDYNAAAICGLDFINTTFNFIRNSSLLLDIIVKYKVRFYDLRDVSYLKAYPNPEIVNRKSKIIFVTGTDCGLGKRTAAYELTQLAIKQGYNAVMYATGQTGLMLGEKGTPIDSLIMEFSNGVISQHIYQLCLKEYDMIFVEGQSDIFHPAYSVGTLSLLHGSNPDCVIIVHDDFRKTHKGFDDEAELYKMHSLKRYIDVLEMLSLPCGPEYKTVGIATIGQDNIQKIKSIPELKGMPVADVLMEGGPEILLHAVKNYLGLNKNNVLIETFLN